MDATLYVDVSDYPVRCSNNFIGVNKDTGQCYCVDSMDCDSGNGDTNVLTGHYMFAKESASGVSTCLVGVVASTCYQMSLRCA